MDRKSIVAISIAVVVMVVWQSYYQRQLNLYQKAQAAKAAAMATPSPSATASPSASAVATTGTSVTAPAEVKIPATPQEPEKTETITTKTAVYTFTNHGGGISSIKLLKHEGATPGEFVTLNTSGTHPIGSILQDPNDADDTYHVSVDGNLVTCEQTTPLGLQIVKSYKVQQDPGQEYKVSLDVSITNRASAPISNGDLYLYLGAVHPVHATELMNYTGFTWYHGGESEYITPHWFSAGGFFGMHTSEAKSVYAQAPGNVKWAAVRNQYFTSLIADPTGTAKGVSAKPYNAKVEGQDLKGIEGSLQLAGMRLKPGESIQKSFLIYAGPAEYSRLAALGHGEDHLIDMDHWWITRVIVRTVGLLLLNVMNWINGFVGNYALSIIILTFIVRAILWPIQGRANKSMKRMQVIQPKVNDLREKYKDDPAKMNQEVFKLYREYKVNPMAGCLPALIQIPIFLAFFTMLGTAVELRSGHFLWVHDLSRPDTVFHIAGFPINVLPICMAATMILQMQLTPKTGDPAQQRMMMFMPLMFVTFTYKYASALALYYTVQNILSIIQLYVTRNQPIPAVVKEPVAKKQRRGL
jgi:YidC/Oxa1 family membrane protein insertase